MAQQTFHSSFPVSAGPMDSSAFDVSNRLAREQIARQVASSSMYRRQQQQQQARVYKPVSTGNSPQNLARRRQAAGPRLPYQTPDAHQVLRRRAATAASGRPLSMNIDSRPVSWHPNSSGMVPPGGYASRHSMYEVNQQFDPFQTVSVNGLPTPVAQAQMNDLSMSDCFSLASSPVYPNGYAHVPVSNDWSVDAAATSQLLTPTTNYQATPMAYPVDYMQASFALYQQMMNGQVQQGIETQTAPASPDVLIIQKPDEMASITCESEDSDDEDEGPELVGMGLYDATPEPEQIIGMSALNGGSPTGSKMLKLCDAWTPPEDDGSENGDAEEDEEDDDEDDEAEDDGEDVDEEAEPKEDCSPLGGGNQLPYGDLSNKTFLLDDADALGAAALTEMTMSDWRLVNGPTWS